MKVERGNCKNERRNILNDKKYLGCLITLVLPLTRAHTCCYDCGCFILTACTVTLLPRIIFSVCSRFCTSLRILSRWSGKLFG